MSYDVCESEHVQIYYVYKDKIDNIKLEKSIIKNVSIPRINLTIHIINKIRHKLDLSLNPHPPTNSKITQTINIRNNKSIRWQIVIIVIT